MARGIKWYTIVILNEDNSKVEVKEPGLKKAKERAVEEWLDGAKCCGVVGKRGAIVWTPADDHVIMDVANELQKTYGEQKCDCRAAWCSICKGF